MQAREEVIAKYGERENIKDPTFAAMIEDIYTGAGRFLKSCSKSNESLRTSDDILQVAYFGSATY